MISDSNLPKTPRFDKSQALAHLKALGYTHRCSVFLGFIKAGHGGFRDKGKNTPNTLNAKEIEQNQRKGYDVYFVVNGQGDDDAAVTQCRAIFYEHDNLDKGLQRELWKSLGLPEPTFQVDTGGKSIHSYWVFDKPISKQQWEPLQSDLLEYSDGDRVIKNPSRIMRLAGSSYMKGDKPGTTQARIISDSGKRYTFEELRKAVPTAASAPAPAPAPSLKFETSTNDAIPLYQCLSKDDRALIDAGAKSDRNTNGAKLARNLIGTAARLDHLGHRYEGDPYQLFIDYCHRCNQGDGWNQREWDTIWKSAQKDNPTPTLTDEAIENCVKAWHRNQQKANKRMVQVDKAAGGTGDRSNVINHPTAERVLMTDDAIASAIDNLIAEGHTPSKLQLAIATLAKEANRSERTIWEAYRFRLAEIEQAEARGETAADLATLLTSSSSTIDIATVIPPNIAEPIKKLAALLNLRPELYLTLLLTVVSILSKVGTKLVIHNAMDFEVTPNLFSGIVAESSQKKSPVIKAMITKPLGVLQQKAREEFEEAKKQFEKDIQKWENLKGEERIEAFPEGKPKAPRMKRYYFSNTTNEGLIAQVQAHPEQGILANVDELAGLLKSANAYRQGRGSDEEDLLSYYDGTGSSVLRADGMRADLDGLLLGIAGSIQPGVLQQMMRDCSDANGKWARFMFVNQPCVASEMLPDTGSLEISPMLAHLYQEADRLPPTVYRLSKDAQAYYRKAYNKLEHLRANDPSQSMRSVWGKSEGRIGKLAINLHIISALANKQTPSEIIERETIVAAAALTKFYASQVQALYMEFADPDAIAPMLAKVIEISKRKDGWIKASDVYQSITKKQRPSPEKVRVWFDELVAMGKGQTRGAGRSVEFSALEQPTETKLDDFRQLLDDSSKTTTTDIYGLQPKLDKLDVLDDSSKAIGNQPQTNLDKPNLDNLSNPSNLVQSHDEVDNTALDDLSKELSKTSNLDERPTDSQAPLGEPKKNILSNSSHLSNLEQKPDGVDIVALDDLSNEPSNLSNLGASAVFSVGDEVWIVGSGHVGDRGTITRIDAANPRHTYEVLDTQSRWTDWLPASALSKVADDSADCVMGLKVGDYVEILVGTDKGQRATVAGFTDLQVEVKVPSDPEPYAYFADQLRKV